MKILASNIYTFAVCPQELACKEPGCGKEFANRKNLMDHMRRHEGGKTYDCNLPDCGMAFKHAHHLKLHIKTHTGEKPFECGLCKKCFSHAGTLRRHMTIHTREVSSIEERKVRI
jgi:uncharacterized Zn-finger protein